MVPDEAVQARFFDDIYRALQLLLQVGQKATGEERRALASSFNQEVKIAVFSGLSTRE